MKLFGCERKVGDSLLFDVEMMSQADYSVYLSGGNDYICATVTVEADSPESAAEQVAKRYPFMLVHKEYVKPSKKTSPDDSQYQKYYGKKYGRWVNPHWVNSNYACNCSVCGGEAMHREFRWLEKGIYPICPNCGAGMMRGDLMDITDSLVPYFEGQISWDEAARRAFELYKHPFQWNCRVLPDMR